MMGTGEITGNGSVVDNASEVTNVVTSKSLFGAPGPLVPSGPSPEVSKTGTRTSTRGLDERVGTDSSRSPSSRVTPNR